MTIMTSFKNRSCKVCLP